VLESKWSRFTNNSSSKGLSWAYL